MRKGRRWYNPLDWVAELLDLIVEVFIIIFKGLD